MITLVIAGLTAAILYLLSRENERTFTLHVVNDTLFIHKGKLLPFGSAPWNTEDEAYAPLPLEGFRPDNIETSRYNDTGELDRALFPILEALAKPRILSEDPLNQKHGIAHLRRAELLKGLAPEQQNALKALRAEGSFYIAKTRLSEAELFLQETLAQLKLATQMPNKHSQAASHALHILEPALSQLSLAIQNALIYPHAQDFASPPLFPNALKPAAEPLEKLQEKLQENPQENAEPTSPFPPPEQSFLEKTSAE